MTSQYDTDFVAWADTQADLLTERRFDLLDLPNLIEEVRDLAGQYRDALESHLRVALTHLLKLAYTQGSIDPDRGWRISVRNARKSAKRLLRKSPSLVSHTQGLFGDAWADARVDAHDELDDYGDTHAPFPDACPWTLEQVLDEDFWPEDTAQIPRAFLLRFEKVVDEDSPPEFVEGQRLRSSWDGREWVILYDGAENGQPGLWWVSDLHTDVGSPVLRDVSWLRRCEPLDEASP